MRGDYVNETNRVCIYCQRGPDEIPLVSFVFRDTETWICSQHLPILIHQPARLAGKLPGAENLKGLEGHDPD